MKRLPKFLYPLFWDINPAKLDVDKHPKYVIERIMNRGDIDDMKWLLANFKKDFFRKTLCESRQLSKKAAIFWALYLQVSQEKVLCLSREFQRTHKAIWPY